jgi:hypothetical protein
VPSVIKWMYLHDYVAKALRSGEVGIEIGEAFISYPLHALLEVLWWNMQRDALYSFCESN